MKQNRDVSGLEKKLLTVKIMRLLKQLGKLTVACFYLVFDFLPYLEICLYILAPRVINELPSVVRFLMNLICLKVFCKS